MSSRHAELRPENAKLFIMDLGSSNGTYVNDRQLTANKPMALSPGDKVVIGEHVFTLKINETGDSVAIQGSRPLQEVPAAAKIGTAMLDTDSLPHVRAEKERLEREAKIQAEKAELEAKLKKLSALKKLPSFRPPSSDEAPSKKAVPARFILVSSFALLACLVGAMTHYYFISSPVSLKDQNQLSRGQDRIEIPVVSPDQSAPAPAMNSKAAIRSPSSCLGQLRQ